MNSLLGKVAIVTGAASGQGAAIAKRFADEGAQVVLTDLNEKGSDVAHEIGSNAVFSVHDVAEADSWGTVVDAAIGRFGKINILINNAGVAQAMPISATDEALLDLHYRVNQRGVFLGMRSVIEPMKAAGGGVIINTSSGAGLRGLPGVTAYGMTKWAVRGMTKSAAVELAQFGIRVVSVHPGMVDTPMLAGNTPERNQMLMKITPLGRMATSEEIAHLMAFLVSDDAGFITGAEVAIDGGLSL